jgi:O-antigen ligase
MNATAIAAPQRPRPSTSLPVPPALLTVATLGAAVVIGALFAYDARLGIVGLLGVLYLPVVLINLPLAAVLWVPLAFVGAIPKVNLISLTLVILLIVAWLGVLPARRTFVASFLRRNAALLWGVALLAAWLAASIAWAGDPGAAIANVWDWFISAAVFMLLATTITRPRHLIALIIAMAAGVSIAALAGYLPSSETDLAAQVDGRLSGGLGDPNYLAAAIVPVIALTVGLAINTRQRGLRWAMIAVNGFLLFSLLATGSRGGLVAATVAAIAAITISRSTRVRLGGIIATVVAILGLWFVANSSDTWGRIKDFDSSGTGRVELWTVAWRMGEDHPLIGVGVNNFLSQSVNYVRQPGQLQEVHLISEQPHVAHNIYLQQFAETGLVGLGLLVYVLIAALGTTWKAVRKLERAGLDRIASLGRSILVAQLSVLAASTFISNGYDKVLWVLLALSPILGTIAARSDPEIEEVWA